MWRVLLVFLWIPLSQKGPGRCPYLVFPTHRFWIHWNWVEDKSPLSEKNRKKLKIKVLDEIKISVIVSDKFSMLELPGQESKIDPNTAIFGYDDRFREWCKNLFQYYWTKSYPCFWKFFTKNTIGKEKSSRPQTIVEQRCFVDNWYLHWDQKRIVLFLFPLILFLL